MVKRVSMKGKGADIFFGGDTALSRAEVSPADVPPTGAVPQPQLVNIPDEQPSMQERKHASMQERKQLATPVDQPASTLLPPEILESIWQDISHRATITNAFRYTDRELSQLTDAIYEISKRHEVKLTKQDIARLGLNAVLWDYRARGDASLLGALALRRKTRQGKEP